MPPPNTLTTPGRKSKTLPKKRSQPRDRPTPTWSSRYPSSPRSPRRSSPAACPPGSRSRAACPARSTNGKTAGPSSRTVPPRWSSWTPTRFCKVCSGRRCQPG
uniref:(northern house mosquito) hypothetical protein n=1 Tax=Culex pipiens TaxID=7175 RepID=A0A8D8DFA8_CULPI